MRRGFGESHLGCSTAPFPFCAGSAVFFQASMTQAVQFGHLAVNLPGFRGHFPLCGEGSTNGQEASSCLSLGVPG
jgi:hypothetical protein